MPYTRIVWVARTELYILIQTGNTILIQGGGVGRVLTESSEIGARSAPGISFRGSFTKDAKSRCAIGIKKQVLGMGQNTHIHMR